MRRSLRTQSARCMARSARMHGLRMHATAGRLRGASRVLVLPACREWKRRSWPGYIDKRRAIAGRWRRGSARGCWSHKGCRSWDGDCGDGAKRQSPRSQVVGSLWAVPGTMSTVGLQLPGASTSLMRAVADDHVGENCSRSGQC